MLKKDVEIGGTYTAKVSEKVVPVKLLRPNPWGTGWIGQNTVTGREVTIKTAARLRRRLG